MRQTKMCVQSQNYEQINKQMNDNNCITVFKVHKVKKKSVILTFV